MLRGSYCRTDTNKLSALLLSASLHKAAASERAVSVMQSGSDAAVNSAHCLHCLLQSISKLLTFKEIFILPHSVSLHLCPSKCCFVDQ